MNISPQMMLVIIIVMLFVAAWYSTNSKRNKILCFYRGRDKTLESRWINITDTYVTLRNKLFYVDTRRIVNYWYKGGIHFLFPTKVSTLEYNWSSQYPHDPDDYKNVWLTPEARKLINMEDTVKAFGKTFTPPSVKKESMIKQYLPLVTVILLVVLGFWVYNNFQGISQALNQMNDKINTIVK